MRNLLTHHRALKLTAWLCLLSIGTAASAETLFDPTQPYSARSTPRISNAVAAAPLQLEAILHSSARRVAIINGQLVHEGDRIANRLIETISPTAVRYSVQGQQHTLTLAAAITPAAHLNIRPSTLTSLAKDTQP